MTTPAAFQATYSDFKLIKTRQCVQIIFEVPLAAYDNAAKILGGMPDPAHERWFGIAPLRSETTATEAIPNKKPWRDLSAAQQAAIRCNEPIFWAFLREDFQYDPMNSNDAAIAVRELCSISSRSELNTNPAARIAWLELNCQFQAWKSVEDVL